MKDFNHELEKAFADTQGDSAFRMDRERPYNGQPHTHNGERGRTTVTGLTIRDIADCIVRGFLDSGGIRSENPMPEDVYKIDTNLDPIVTVQCTVCWIEKYMGIYPNVPKLKVKP